MSKSVDELFSVYSMGRYGYVDDEESNERCDFEAGFAARDEEVEQLKAKHSIVLDQEFKYMHDIEMENARIQSQLAAANEKLEKAREALERIGLYSHPSGQIAGIALAFLDSDNAATGECLACKWSGKDDNEYRANGCPPCICEVKQQVVINE